MFDLDDRRFRPLWIRVLITGICAGWATIFAALGVWTGWRFFLTFDPPEDTERKP